jgi:aromatic-L-amino-acid/L-tryptophan decarboxylase
LKAYGIERLAEVIQRNCRQAQLLGRAVAANEDLELLAAVALNIVCFRYRAPLDESELTALNAAIVAELHLRGIAAPSTTRIRGRTAIRVCLVNHRTTTEDLAILVDAVRRLGQELMPRPTPARPRVLESERR